MEIGAHKRPRPVHLAEKKPTLAEQLRPGVLGG